MALGSSAPEIMLSLLETIWNIEDEPKELGPNTIVGSAAFNLLIITAVSIVSVDEIKYIDDLLVFTITSMFSLFAYVWMLIVYTAWTPDVITIPEALLTMFFLVFLILFAYMADRYKQKKRNKEKTAEELEELENEN